MSKPKDVAKLFWGGNTLWLGPWAAAAVEPVWYGDKRDIPPHGWRWRVGVHSNGEQAYGDALSRAEWVAMGQLRSIGIRAAEFTRPDTTVRKLEMP